MEGEIKDLTYKKKDIIGLDLGTSSVKFVQLKEKGKLTKLIGYGKVDIPENIIVEGIVSEPEKLAALLKKSFQEPPWGEITAHRVIASLPESKIFTRIIELPTLSKKDLKEAVAYEIEQSIPVSKSDLYTDWQIIEETKDKIKIFLSAAPKSIVDSYIQLFSILKLEPLALEMSLAAIARAMVSNKENVEPVLILDLGGSTTNMTVFDSNLQITESLPTGGTTLKKDLSETLSLSEKEAGLLVKEGLKGKKQQSLIETELDKILIEIKKMIDYYSEKQGTGKIKKILVCGGLASLPGLVDYLKEKTDLEIKLGNPWVNISIYPLKPVPKDQAAGYAAAIGLCLRGFSDD